MNRRLILSLLASVLFTAACGDDPVEPTPPIPPAPAQAKVRFFTAAWNAPDGIGFTANNQFVAGSALQYGQSTQTCSSLKAETTTFAVGVPNASGTALNGGTLGSLGNQTLVEGGNYTVLAGGQSIHPSVIMLDNTLSAPLGPNQAAVRFVNLAAVAQFPFSVLKGTAGSGSTTVVQNDLAFRAATPFSIVTSGPNAYTIMNNNSAVISGSAATLNFQSGTVNTVVIIRNATTNAFELTNVPSCS